METSGKCVESPIPNCIGIDPVSMRCDKCQNGFFLENNECVKVEEIKNCLIYDPDSRRSCLTCGPNSKKLTIKTCKPVDNKIKNCKNYLNSETCKECEDGFVLPDCNPILFSENCLVKKPDDNLCIKCNSRSFMYNDNCYYKQDLGLDTCTNKGFDLSQQPFVCSFCENTAEIVTIKPFNAICDIEKFQDFFGGKCISAKINSNGKFLFCF